MYIQQANWNKYVWAFNFEAVKQLKLLLSEDHKLFFSAVLHPFPPVLPQGHYEVKFNLHI